MSEIHRPRVAIVGSGGGTTAQAYVEAIGRGTIDHEVGAVLSNNLSVGIIEKAESWNAEYGFDLETAIINNKKYPGGPNGRGQTEQAAEEMCKVLQRGHYDAILFMGYMVILSEPFISEYGFVPGRHTRAEESAAINWHPGPLPLTADTYGEGASAKVLGEYRECNIEHSMHSVHAVAQKIDSGPMVLETPVPIKDEDTPETLFERTQWVEKAVTPHAADMFIRGRQRFLADQRRSMLLPEHMVD